MAPHSPRCCCHSPRCPWARCHSGAPRPLRGPMWRPSGLSHPRRLGCPSPRRCCPLLVVVPLLVTLLVGLGLGSLSELLVQAFIKAP